VKVHMWSRQHSGIVQSFDHIRQASSTDSYPSVVLLRGYRRMVRGRTARYHCLPYLGQA